MKRKSGRHLALGIMISLFVCAAHTGLHATIWPIEGASPLDVISPFGPRYYGQFDFHDGTDIVAGIGTDVLCTDGFAMVLASKYDLPHQIQKYKAPIGC
jgi:hypothetical protein